MTKQKFKIARIIKGVSQQELAKILNVSQPLISAWERGFKEPNEEQKKKIEKILGKIEW